MVTDVKIGESPEFIQRRLIAAGIVATDALNRKREEQTDSRSELEQMFNNH